MPALSAVDARATAVAAAILSQSCCFIHTILSSGTVAIAATAVAVAAAAVAAAVAAAAAVFAAVGAEGLHQHLTRQC